jgi:hypothetical protein
MFAAYNADFDFTCLEMTDSSTCNSQPQELVKQTILASQKAGIGTIFFTTFNLIFE